MTIDTFAYLVIGFSVGLVAGAWFIVANFHVTRAPEDQS